MTSFPSFNVQNLEYEYGSLFLNIQRSFFDREPKLRSLSRVNIVIDGEIGWQIEVRLAAAGLQGLGARGSADQIEVVATLACDIVSVGGIRFMLMRWHLIGGQGMHILPAGVCYRPKSR